VSVALADARAIVSGPDMTKVLPAAPVDDLENEALVADCATAATTGDATVQVGDAASVEAAGNVAEPGLVTASHRALFQVAEQTSCDACGAPLPDSEEDDGFGVPGYGVYMWTRGDTVRFERAPLCASCASAIGMTALARWEIEEEEG
jgi:hypothetical protein